MIGREQRMHRGASPRFEPATVQFKLPFPSKARDIYSLIVSFIPLICLAAGLMLLYEFHNDQTALELAEIDSALLIDDLPPQAYTDPAFLDFLKNQSLQKD